LAGPGDAYSRTSKEVEPMGTKDLLDRLTKLPDHELDTPTVPPVELVAFVVRWNRGLRTRAGTIAPT
jgi:hypothetical protein